MGAYTHYHLDISIERIKGAMPNLESAADEAQECVQKGFIKDYSINLTSTSLKLVVYGEDFARFVLWDRGEGGVLKLQNHKGMAE